MSKPKLPSLPELVLSSAQKVADVAAVLDAQHKREVTHLHRQIELLREQLDQAYAENRILVEGCRTCPVSMADLRDGGCHG